MNWPFSHEFNEAIQNPQTAFADPDLKGGEAVVGATGLPLPRSGNFADVYQVRGTDGRDWAVKCFTRPVVGLADRYARISEALAKAGLPFTIGFTFLAEGIRVGGVWCPIVKMEWVEGFLLNQVVRENAAKPVVLAALGQLWVKLCKRLREAGVAHADLQHGNVLLVPGSRSGAYGLKLIDYDGMYVPALANTPSGESGHPSYQHPARVATRAYSPDVDRFPHLVVATALKGLAVGGSALWERYDNGDNLLFTEDDYKRPSESRLMRELWHTENPTVQALVGRLAIACGKPIPQTPWLDQLAPDGEPAPLDDETRREATLALGIATPVVVSADWVPAVATATPAPFEVVEEPLAPEARPNPPVVLSPQPRSHSRARRSRRQFLVNASALVFLVLTTVGVIAATIKFWPRPKSGPIEVVKGNPIDPRVPTPPQPGPAPKDTKLPPRPVDPGRVPDPPKPEPVPPVAPPRPGQAFEWEVAPGVKMVFCWVPSGRAQLGAPADEHTALARIMPGGKRQTWMDAESAAHRPNYVTTGFWLGKFEVTQSEWTAVMGSNPSAFDRKNANSAKGLDTLRFPVESVNWRDCQDFIGKLNARAGTAVPVFGTRVGVALPHEDEWEYACRGGQGNDRPFHFGAVLDGRQANVDGTAPWGGPGKGTTLGRPTTVGSYEKDAPHPWNLCDMHGSVAEWCENIYAPGEDTRVLRGGHWAVAPWECRSANRYRAPPGISGAGLRVCVRPITSPEPGDVRKVEIADSVFMEFCWVPPGEAQLGSTKAERDAVMRERDLKKEPEWLPVEAEESRGKFKTTGYWLGKYEVTQEEWKSVMGNNPSYFSATGGGKGKFGTSGPLAPASVKGIDARRFPVEQVSWDDCQAFLTKLNGKAKASGAIGEGSFVLPHEDEWEYACRGGKGNKQAFYFGDELNGHQANVDGTAPYGTATKGPSLKRTEKVGSYETRARHPWNLCDLSGNVYEWCASKNLDEEKGRVLRGGAWSDPGLDSRTAFRRRFATSDRNFNIGFRVCFRPTSDFFPPPGAGIASAPIPHPITAPKVEKHPVPAEDELKAVREQYRATFKVEYDKLTPTSSPALAAKLLAAAKDEKPGSANRYALLVEVMQLSEMAGNYGGVIDTAVMIRTDYRTPELKDVVAASLARILGTIEKADEFKRVAASELERPATPAALVSVGKDWLAVIAHCRADARHVAARRARLRILEGLASPTIKGLDRVEAEKSVQEAVGEIEAADAKAGKFTLYAGKWAVTYENKFVVEYVITDDGTLVCDRKVNPEGKVFGEKEKSKLTRREEVVVVPFAQGKVLERFEVRKDTLMVERFSPPTRFPKNPENKGEGVRVPVK